MTIRISERTETREIAIKDITLLSTVLSPGEFRSGTLRIILVEDRAFLRECLRAVTLNVSGHPETLKALRTVWHGIPEPTGGRWVGGTVGLAARPRSGVRGRNYGGDIPVSVDDLEIALVIWTPDEEE